MTKRKFLWLVGKYYDLLIAAALKKCQDAESAADNVQAAVARLLARKSYLSAEGTNRQLKGWLARVVVNETLGQLRRKQGEELSSMFAVELDGTATLYSGTRTVYPTEPQIDGKSSGPLVALPRAIRRAPEPLKLDVARAVSKLSHVQQLIAEGCLMGYDTPESAASVLDLPWARTSSL